MKKMLNNKKVLILVIIIALLFVIACMGIVFSWYQSAEKETKTTNTLDTQNKNLKRLGKTDIHYSALTPGWTDTKVFAISNTGTESITYALEWKDISNNFIRPTDLVLSLTSTNNGGVVTEQIIPTTGKNINIISDITIGMGVTQEYVVTFAYKKVDGEDQSIDSKSSFTGMINAISLN